MAEEIRHENIDYTLFENIKMKMLGMINSSDSPYEIIYEIAKELESITHEAGYAHEVREGIRAVYGFALQDRRLLADELTDVRERLARIEESRRSGDFSEEEIKRIDFAAVLHKKNIERLEAMIQHAEAYHEEPYLDKL
ncbi:hypothetical protein QCO44_03595 [Selenomonas sputigena]|mgnify:CR=1 FL=1|uniref:Uncharacterized protein n=1 Tax=Selenomonas sputigena TaxID=69823 RepID=A0ABV3X3G0_9FIRM